MVSGMVVNMPGQNEIPQYVFDARPDTIDFRDRMYEPTLVEVPPRVELQEYLDYQVPVLQQGPEGACTGFALVTVAHYLLRRRSLRLQPGSPEGRQRRTLPDMPRLSPRMAYEMAKRYDEWPGEGYQGSTARGAMKGWHKHGLCSAEAWPYLPGSQDSTLTHERAADAALRPLGAYLRVNHKDLVAMHSALAEVGVLFATGWAHSGWPKANAEGIIPYETGATVLGGHAFAIVAYDERGFWIQNSWGTGWGKAGLGLLAYDDWLSHGMDVWAARLGVPVQLRMAESTAASTAPGAVLARSYAFSDLRPHIIALGEGGALNAGGTFGASEEDIAMIFREDIPRLTRDWEKKRIVVNFPGGLVAAPVSIQRAAESRATFLKARVFPLTILWQGGLWNMLAKILQEAVSQRRSEGTLPGSLDFMLDRLDDTLEPLVRALGGRVQWQEVKNSALDACLELYGAGRILLKYLAEWSASHPGSEIHLLAHSAGSFFLAPFARLLTQSGKIKSGDLQGATGLGVPVVSCTLWAPALSIEDFVQLLYPAIRKRQIQRFALYTLTDQAEKRDHCAHIYNKSLLYLASNALEPRRSAPLLGLEEHVLADARLVHLFKTARVGWVRAPNTAAADTVWASAARHHGDFDDNELTLLSTLARILNAPGEKLAIEFQRSEASLREKRQQLESLSG